MRLSALSLLECMREAGHPLSSGAYSGIESGENLPRDVAGFLQATRQCLALGDDDMERLKEDLAFDLVEGRMDRETAQRVVQRHSDLARALQTWRNAANLTADALARCLMKHDFATDHKLDTRELASDLDAIERGSPLPIWLSSLEVQGHFIAACRACLGAQAGADFEDAILEEVRKRLRNGTPSLAEPAG
jgi:hypothetical protein